LGMAQLQAEIRRKLQADVERHLHEQRTGQKCQLPSQQPQQAPRRSSSVIDIGRDEPPTPRTGRRGSSIRGSSIHASAVATAPPAFLTAPSDNSVRDACRFQDGAYRRKQPVGVKATSSAGASAETKAAAGAAKAITKYIDMPPDTHGSRGRARSMTPDYYRRYAGNAIGTSLPGASRCNEVSAPLQRGGSCSTFAVASTAEPALCSAPQLCTSPRTSSAGRRACIVQGQPTPCRKSHVECRFHYDSEPRTRVDSWARPFNVSSAEARPTAAFAGSLSGNGSCPRLPPQTARGGRCGWVF